MQSENIKHIIQLVLVSEGVVIIDRRTIIVIIADSAARRLLQLLYTAKPRVVSANNVDVNDTTTGEELFTLFQASVRPPGSNCCRAGHP